MNWFDERPRHGSYDPVVLGLRTASTYALRSNCSRRERLAGQTVGASNKPSGDN